MVRQLKAVMFKSQEEGQRFTAGSGWLSGSPHIRMTGIHPPEVLHVSGHSRKCCVECIVVNSIPQGWGQKNVHSFFSSRSIRATWEHSHLSVGDLNFGSQRFWRVHTSQLYLVFDLLNVSISLVCCDQKADTGWLHMTGNLWPSFFISSNFRGQPEVFGTL